jgi:thiol-disulfide isomerase/thioredoxin
MKMTNKTASIKCIFCLITCLLYLGCVQATSSASKDKAREEKGTIVFIRPKNSIAREIQFINRYDNTELLEFGQEDTIRIKSSEPINVINPASTNIRCFRFYPNDTIQVIKSAGNSIPVYLTGNSTRDKEISYLSKNSYLFFSPQPKTIENPSKEINEQASKEAASLKYNGKLAKFSQSFVEEESENINNLREAKLLLLLLNKQNLTPTDLAPYISTFNSDRFTYLLSFKQKSDYYLEALKIVFKNDIPKTFNWINSNVSGNTKDIFFFKLINRTDALKDQDIKKRLIVQYRSLAKDSLYKNYILKNQELANIKYLGKNKNLIADNMNRTKTINSLIESLKNKVIFIDLWASWCVPCRAEMPFSKKLKRELVNNKEIKFLYISLDKDKAMWENAEKELDLKSEESYLFIDSFDADFLKNLQVKTIPRYLIISKNGSINQSDAPGPRDPKLKDMLLKLVN